MQAKPMAWENRDYYRTSGDGGDYLANPLGALNLSVPFGTWFGARVRLHFWLLLVLVISSAGPLLAGDLVSVLLTAALLIAAVLLHEFGHRIAAHWVGGQHDEFMLWPAGGMIPPTAPLRPLPYFVAHAGGIAMNVVLAVGCYAAIAALTSAVPGIYLDPLAAFRNSAQLQGHSVPSILATFAAINIGVTFAAILPYYWFDGGPLLQSILWPFVGLRTGIKVTCIVGMVLAVPLFFLSLAGGNILGMLMWALLFADSYRRFHAARFDTSLDFQESAAQVTPSGSSRRRWRKRRSPLAPVSQFLAKRKAAAQEQLEADVDRILEKVHTQGMQSLTEKERQTLTDASKHLREERAF
jgi:hypothetical protein